MLVQRVLDDLREQRVVHADAVEARLVLVLGDLRLVEAEAGQGVCDALLPGGAHVARSGRGAASERAEACADELASADVLDPVGEPGGE